MDFTGKLTTPADAQKFVFAGNATITLKSLKTGSRFTFKISKSENGKVFFVSTLVGPENTTDFAYLGFFNATTKAFKHGGAKAKVSEEAPSAKAFSWFAPQLEGMTFHDSLEVWHEGRCGRCNRKLTVPASIKSGFGPECASQMGVILAEELPLEEPQQAPKVAKKATKKAATKLGPTLEQTLNRFFKGNADTVNIPLRKGRGK